jgi:hypothetical protein
MDDLFSSKLWKKKFPHGWKKENKHKNENEKGNYEKCWMKLFHPNHGCNHLQMDEFF